MPVSLVLLATELSPPAFTPEEALGTLLTAEGLLLAALSIVLALAAPSGRRVLDLPVRATTVASLAVGLLVVMAFGATLAWGKIYWSSFPADFPGRIIAIVILVAVLAQPVLAWIIAQGAKPRG